MNNNTQNKPKPHPHAELIKAWADGAKIQYSFNGIKWDDCVIKPEWDPDTQYRIKPEASSNKPWKPKHGETYCFICSEGTYLSETWTEHGIDFRRYSFGNCFRTREEAEAAAERVKSALKGGIVNKEEYERALKQNKELQKELNTAKEHIYNNAMTAVVQNSQREFCDGKPLSDGETALIRALRNVKVARIPDYMSSVLCYLKPQEAQIGCVNTLIAFTTSSTTSEDEAVIAALKQIKAEQKEGK